MDAQAYFRKHGVERCREICNKAGTTLEYFRQIMCGHRRPSPELAEKFLLHSGGEMDLASLLTSRRRKRRNVGPQ